jgi:hypothetical protein
VVGNVGAPFFLKEDAMSRLTHGVGLGVCFSATLFLVGAIPLLVQAGPLEEARARREVEAQRLERKVRDGRLSAYTLVRKDPEKLIEAADILVSLQVALRNDVALPQAKRDSLLALLARDIKEVTRISRELRRANDLATAAARDALRQRTDRGAAQQKSAYDQARARLGSTRGRVADLRDLQRLGDKRYLRVGDSIARSAVLPADDIEFPADWAEKTRKRSPESKLTDKEKSLLRALASPISVDLERETLSDVLDYFRQRMGQEIIIEKRALDELGLTYDSPVTLKLKNISTRTALKRLLADLGLTFVIKDEAILVTSPERARHMVTTRTYYLGDLAPLVDLRFGPVISRLQMAQNVSLLMRQIVTNIEPSSWRVNNPEASGTIIFDPIRMALIVQQSAEVHYKLQGVLP